MITAVMPYLSNNAPLSFPLSNNFIIRHLLRIRTKLNIKIELTINTNMLNNIIRYLIYKLERLTKTLFSKIQKGYVTNQQIDNLLFILSLFIYLCTSKITENKLKGKSYDYIRPTQRSVGTRACVEEASLTSMRKRYNSKKKS